MNVLLIYDLQGFLHKYPTDCLRLQEIGVIIFFFSGGGPPNPPNIRMYLYHTIPQIYSKDILDFAIKTLKKIAFKNFIRTTTECSRLQEKGVNLKKKKKILGTDPPT